MKLKLVSGVAGVVVVGVLGLLAKLGATERELTRTREEARASFLAHENTAARLDTTRLVADQYRREAEQHEIARDSLATALNERPVVETQVTIHSHSIDTIVVEKQDTVTTERSIPDTLRVDYADSVLSIHAGISTYFPYSAALRYELAPISLIVGGRCGVPDPLGYRTATITVQTALDVDVDQAQLDPDLCNHTAPIIEHSSSHWRITVPVVSFALGVFAHMKFGDNDNANR